MPIIKTEDTELPYLTLSQIKCEPDTFPHGIKSEPFILDHVHFQQQDIKLEYGTPGTVIKPEPHIKREVSYSVRAVVKSERTPHPSLCSFSSEQLAVIKRLKRERYRMRRKAKLAAMTEEEKEAKKQKKQRKRQEKMMGKEGEYRRAERKEKRRLRVEKRDLKWRLQGIGRMGGGVVKGARAHPQVGLFGGAAAQEKPGMWRSYESGILQPWREYNRQLCHPWGPGHGEPFDTPEVYQPSMPNLESRLLPGQPYRPSELEPGWESHHESAVVPQPEAGTVSDDDSDSEVDFDRISYESDNDSDSNLDHEVGTGQVAEN